MSFVYVAPALGGDDCQAPGGHKTAWSGIAVLAGCVLLPYNCLLIAQDYFNKYAFPGKQFPFTSMICYSGPLCIAQAILTVVADRYSVAARMRVSFWGHVVVNLALLTVTILSQDESKADLLNVICLITVVALACMNSLMQTAVMGVAGTMGEHFSAAAMFGFGICGLLAFALSLLMEAFLGSDDSSGTKPMIQAAVLFGFCVLFTVCSAALYYGCFSRRVPPMVHALVQIEDARLASLRNEDVAALATRALESAEQNGDATPEDGKGTVGSVVKAVLPQAFNVWLVFSVSLCLFPGIVASWEPEAGSAFAQNPGLFTRCLVGTFQVCDVAGRYLASPFARFVPPGKLWLLVVLRLLFVPAFILGQRQPTPGALWSTDAGRFTLVALMAMSNGFVSSCGMMFGPMRVPPKQRETAGIAMSCTMVTGIFCGTLFAFLTQVGVPEKTA
eukprot:TRINITY_DN81748_c0_g1_i1.p1 TRINITY_DN81748_c0_g1~~TRINITY_DN81748_c0_g1_i1.p1  ORF type:complete len:491 (-),score=66.45 TRINITY_DN81748_c0_g1_i1:172-1509(-)